jgi:hypothetical protein
MKTDTDELAVGCPQGAHARWSHLRDRSDAPCDLARDERATRPLSRVVWRRTHTRISGYSRWISASVRGGGRWVDTCACVTRGRGHPHQQIRRRRLLFFGPTRDNVAVRHVAPHAPDRLALACAALRASSVCDLQTPRI